MIQSLENMTWIDRLCWKHSLPHSKPSQCRSSKVECWRGVNHCAATTTQNNFVSYSAWFQTNLPRPQCGGECAPWRNGSQRWLLPSPVRYPATLNKTAFGEHVAKTLHKHVSQTVEFLSLLLTPSCCWSGLNFPLFSCWLKTDYCWCWRSYLSSSVLGGDRTCGGLWKT